LEPLARLIFGLSAEASQKSPSPALNSGQKILFVAKPVVSWYHFYDNLLPFVFYYSDTFPSMSKSSMDGAQFACSLVSASELHGVDTRAHGHPV